jgi:hypothetical protein
MRELEELIESRIMDLESEIDEIPQALSPWKIKRKKDFFNERIVENKIILQQIRSLNGSNTNLSNSIQA